MNLQQSITTALAKDIGSDTQPNSYGVRALSSAVKDFTVKIVVPTVQNNDFLDMLEDGSDASEFLKRCLKLRHGGGHLFNFFASGSEDEKRKISPADVVGQLRNPGLMQTVADTLHGLNIFSGDLVRLDKAARAWTHKKLVGYVGAFWQNVHKDRSGFGIRFLEQMGLTEDLLNGIVMNPQKEISLGGINITAVLGEYNRDMQPLYAQDPQFGMWKEMDDFFHTNRSATQDVGKSDSRITRTIETGIAAGLDFATGCLSVALEKCQGDKRSALMLFENSLRELLLTQGVMDLSYIAAIAETARHPQLIQKLCVALGAGNYEALGNIVYEAKKARLDFMVEADKYQWQGEEGTTIKLLLDFESRYPFIPELFEIYDGSKLRICPWFIDFMKLINARIKQSLGGVILTKGCPMIHGKVNNDSGAPITFMEDFGTLVVQSFRQYWKI